MKIEIRDILRRYSRPTIIAITPLVLYFGTAKPELNELEQLLDDGTLRVASRLGPLSYYEREGEPNGLDYNFLTALSQHLGVDLQMSLYDEIETQMDSVYNGNHIAASTLTKTESRSAKYQFSESYMDVSAVLIQHSSRKFISDISEIMDEDYSLVAIEGSSHSEILGKIKKIAYPELEWSEESETIMFELMEQVQTKQIDYAVVDSSIYEMERSMFPRLEVAMDLSDPLPVGLVLPIQEDDSLLNAINEFILSYKESGQLNLLTDAYFLDYDSMDIAGALLFKERLKDRLPGYEPLFREVAENHDYDWLLLAAQAYQESHWDANARSPTGVRGLMMLTLPTAKQLGIENRLDPVQSLKGGIEYLLSLHTRIPERIQEPDRTKFALAAYNVGFGHLEDARILTERGDRNPDLWDDVEEFLPLLRQKKYYSTVRRGYARGSEPVSYVNNIFRFKSILDWYTWQKELIDAKQITETEISILALKSDDNEYQALPLGDVNPIDFEEEIEPLKPRNESIELDAQRVEEEERISLEQS